MEAVFSWVKNIVVFFLILTLLEEILPDSNYKKYIRAAAGMVFILIVFSPLIKLLGADNSMDYFFQWESLKTALAVDDAHVFTEFDAQDAVAKKQSWIMSQYKENLKEQIKALVENEGYEVDEVDVQVDELESSESMGSILSIAVDLTGDMVQVNGGDEFLEDSSDIETIQPVTPVQLEDSSAWLRGEENTPAYIDSRVQLNIKQLLSGNYGVDMNQISIRVKGE